MKVVIVLICLFLHSTLAFWSTGHMIVSRIAYEELLARSPSVLHKIEEDLEVLKPWSCEDNHTFVESAVWADDNKRIGFNQFNAWHVNDIPYVKASFPGDIHLDASTNVWAIKEMIETLRFTNEPKMDTGLAISFSWRYLIHLVGDIHQPLHAATLYSGEFPEGDERGVKFLIDYDEANEHLHAFWDSCLDQFGLIGAPLNDEEWDLIGNFAEFFTAVHPRKSLSGIVELGEPETWADESHELARSVAYQGIKSGDRPSQKYIDAGRPVIIKRLALAGYRLADMLENLAKERYPNLEIL